MMTKIYRITIAQKDPMLSPSVTQSTTTMQGRGCASRDKNHRERAIASP